jgi:hypothetical protein
MIKLIHETHTYVNDKFPDMKYTSVTTVLGKYKEQFDEDYHAQRVADRRGVTKAEVIAEWRETNRLANEYGTNLHAILERFLLAPHRIYSPRDEYEKTVINAFKKVCGDEGLTLINSDRLKPEHIMSYEFNDKVGIAGTSDIIEDIDYDKFNVWDFKGLSLDTEIPTEDGFKLMSNINVGDVIFDGEGNLTKVLHVSEIHHNPCYKITFDTNDTIICDHEHKWEITNRLSKYKYSNVIKTTEDLYSMFKQKQPIRIETTEVITEKILELPIDPYVFGVWLGDGSKDCGVLTNMNETIWEELKNRGYDTGPDVSGGSSGLAESRTIYGLRGELNKLGLLKNKHIPDIYLRASKQQRLDLLRGFMDTDGYYNKIRDRCVMITTQQWQADGMSTLLSSLGFKPTTIKAFTTCNNKKIKTLHVCFKPQGGVNPFLSKTEDYNNICLPDTEKSKFRYVKKIEKIDTVPTKCLAVESENHTYLATRNYIKTHNTNKKFEYENKYGEYLHFPVNHLTHCQYNDYTLQLSVYGVMYEMETGRKFNRAGLFYWDKFSQSFKLIPVAYMKREAEMLIDHYKLKTIL